MAPSYRVLYSFAGGTDGMGPYASLIDVKGTLYGTTSAGGKFSNGTVFSITPNGKEQVLYSFDGTRGANPRGGLIYVNGGLFGTTYGGGSHGDGTVFRISRSGAEKVLHSFSGNPDGYGPYATLISVNGTLYGTTYGGGSKCDGQGCGTVFSISTSGAEKVVYGFGGRPDGESPKVGLLDMGGYLYGTTEYGGNDGAGTVFSISTSGVEKVLHSFAYSGPDGVRPVASFIDVKGKLYGTTVGGGGANDYGTAFSISGSGTEKVLYSFPGSSDGAYPEAPLIYMKGSLYGTTFSGGEPGCYSNYGCGTVFRLNPSGAEKVLHAFGGSSSDGDYPVAGLRDVNGTLYGTTESGGTYGDGTVFTLTP